MELYTALDTARADFADLLAGLTPEQWEQPSLCAGWRVREVAAHVALTTAPLLTQVSALLRSGLRFDHMIDSTARANAVKPPEQLVEEVRALVGARRRPPGTDPVDPLNDVLVHTQDVARPLGVTVPIDPAAAALSADLVWKRTFPFRAQARVPGRELIATDVEWRRGAGEPMEAPISELLLILTGRVVRVDDGR
jgi:uncharacterized protein (TIGR03083 family)